MMKHYLITIEGMGCDHCVRRIRVALDELGAQNIEVELGKAKASYDGEPNALKAAIEDLGFVVVELVEA